MSDSSLIYFLNTHGVFVLFVVVLGYLWFKEKSKEEVLHIIFASGLTALLALAVKQIFGIPRPYMLDGSLPLAGYSVRTTSMPSIHTALAFCLATTVFLHQRAFGSILLLIAILIGLGRVMANVHYPVDIAFGAIMGTGIALAFERVHIYHERRRRKFRT